MQSTEGTATSEQDGMKVTETLFTYSEQEQQDNRRNAIFKQAVLNPEFIKWSPTLANMGLSHEANILHGFLEYFSNITQAIELTDEEISYVLRCSNRTSRRVIKELADMGLIIRSIKHLSSGGSLRRLKLTERTKMATPGQDRNGRSSIYKKKKIYMSNSSKSHTEGFNDFWRQYPRKVKRKPAESVYTNLMRNSKEPLTLHAEIMAGLAKFLPEWSKLDSQFIPHAPSWLRAERWNDELEQPTIITTPRI